MDRGLSSGKALLQDQAAARDGLLVVAQLPPPVHGASVVNKQVAESERLRRNFRISLVPIDATTELAEIRKFSLAKVMRSLKTMLRIAQSLQREKPAVAYLTMSPKGFAFWRDCAFLLIFRLMQTRHAVHLHGRGLRMAHFGKWSQAFARLMLAKAEVILLSPLLKQETEGMVAEARLHYVANGVPDPLHGKGLPARRSTGSEPVILFLGTMLESKGPMVLLEALSILHGQDLPFKAVFAGPWRGSLSEREFSDRLHSLGLAGKVCHIGAVYGDAKEQCLLDADILAFPTHYENEAFPLVVLEGMAAGLVPVTSDIAALPDIVEGVGICVPPRQPTALAEALKQIVANPARRAELRAKARAKYLEKFTLPRFEENLAAVLEGAAGGQKMPADDRRA